MADAPVPPRGLAHWQRLADLDQRETRAAEPPPYRPGNPMWDAGFETARRQAAARCREIEAAEVALGTMACRWKGLGAADCADAILAMRPAPPR